MVGWWLDSENDYGGDNGNDDDDDDDEQSINQLINQSINMPLFPSSMKTSNDNFKSSKIQRIK